MINVKYTAPYADYTGYSEAARQTIFALYTAGINVITDRIDFCSEQIPACWMLNLCERQNYYSKDYKVKIIQVTPEFYPQTIEKNKYNIGILFWETDKIPKAWIDNMNKMNEFWVVSDKAKQIFRNSGIKSRLEVFPQPIDTLQLMTQKYEPLYQHDYNFYSIFQWTERKNPKLLIQAFVKAFEGQKHVNLLLKTYRANFGREETNKITEQITRWKSQITSSEYPHIIAYTQPLSSYDLFRLHASSDVFVSPHRGEGWGMSQMQAMAMGKPVISTAYGGIHDYLGEREYLPLKYKMVKVEGMEWIPWYTPDQKWAEASAADLIKKMIWCVLNKKKAAQIGLNAKERVEARFDSRVVGEDMKFRLSKI